MSKSIGTCTEKQQDNGCQQQLLDKKPRTVKPLALGSRAAAEAMGISIRSLRRLEQRGLIRCSRALGKKIYPVCELQNFLKGTI